MNTRVGIAFTDLNQQPHAQALADKLSLPIVAVDDQQVDYLLVYCEDRLELRATHEDFQPLFIDFLGGAVAHRKQYGGGRGQLIARAVGLRQRKNLSILDISAGLGRDAYVLASLGANVLMLERSPIIAALLEDGLCRAASDEEFKVLQLQLIWQDAQHYLTKADKPDVIYYDPMYPSGKKNALVKKEMRILRDIVGSDEDAATILELALQHAKARVVVKRPRLAEAIAGREPSLTFSGKSSRFDVYLLGGEVNE